MKDLKIPIAIAVFVAVVLLGVAGRAIYYQSQVVDPMTELANEVPGVERIEVEEGADGQKDVYVSLERDARLEETYPKVEELAKRTFGDAFGRLVLRDNRSPELTEAYYRVHFLVQEGISTGLFASMAADIDSLLSDLGISEHRVYVGDQYVFVQLRDEGHFLYEIVPRIHRGIELTKAAEGGMSLW